MGQFSEQAAKDVADHYAGITDIGTMPGAWWVELHTADPGKDAVGFESGLGRVEVPNAPGPAWVGTSPNYTNADPVVWVNPASSPLVTHFSIWSAATAGEAYFVAPLTASKQITAGTDAQFAAGDLGIGAD